MGEEIMGVLEEYQGLFRATPSEVMALISVDGKEQVVNLEQFNYSMTRESQPMFEIGTPQVREFIPSITRRYTCILTTSKPVMIPYHIDTLEVYHQEGSLKLTNLDKIVDSVVGNGPPYPHFFQGESVD